VFVLLFFYLPTLVRLLFSAGIVLTPNAMKGFRRLNVADKMYEKGNSITVLGVRNGHGKLLSSYRPQTLSFKPDGTDGGTLPCVVYTWW
jgi:hypothetical protein